MTILLLLLVFSLTAQAEIFQWTDQYGNKHYSDKSHQGAKTLQISKEYSFYQVKKVYDGDTVLLRNGKKVRFLGINTPEVEGRNKSAQAGGEAAKKWLQNKLKNKKIRLEKDVEKKDKYGRLLAYIFTEDKQNINLELVKRGLATVNIHPPNLKYSNELLAAESNAEKGGLGVWRYSDYAVKSASKIKGSRFKGWQRVTGTVRDIHQSRKYIYLNLTDTFALKIQRSSKAYFPDIDSYLGKVIEGRGWINKNKSRYNMFIRHSSAIKLRN